LSTFTAVLIAAALITTPATETPEPPTPVVDESLAYVYQKVDFTLPAGWANSGTQDLIAQHVGVTDFLIVEALALPAHVCGQGWAVQFDVIRHDGSFVVPQTITPPAGPFSLAGVLVKAEHVSLELADCVTDDPPADPMPVVIPDPPTVVPVVPELAKTGLSNAAVIPLALIATGLALLGIVLSVVAGLVKRRRDAVTPRYRRTPDPFELVESSPEVDSTPFPTLLGK